MWRTLEKISWYRYFHVCMCIVLKILASQLECLPIALETGVQSKVKSSQRLKKWYMIPPYLSLRIIRYRSRVKLSNQEKGVVPFSIEKGAFGSPTLLFKYLYKCKFLFSVRYIQVHDWIFFSPISWDGRIHWLHLYRVVSPPPLNKCPGYDIKWSDGEAPALKIWGMWSTTSLPLLPGPLWPGVVAPDSILYMGQTEQTMCADWC